MNSYTKLPKKQLYSILLLCSIIILSETITVMIKVKDVNLFKDYLINLGFTLELGSLYSEHFSSYVAMNLSYFFFNILIPVSISIHSYIAFMSIRISKLFVFIWTVLILGSLAYTIIGFNLKSIFYYINIFSYILLLITILSLNKVIDNIKGL